MTEESRPVTRIGKARPHGAPYELAFRPAALRALRKLDRQVAERIKAATEALRDDPWPPETTMLTGEHRMFRIRVGDYRIIYVVDDETKTVRILLTGHRREVYRGF
jgi:mRNA interferase RelE/StbE